MTERAAAGPADSPGTDLQRTGVSGPELAPYDAERLGRAAGTGFFWSLLNNFVGRFGNFLAGIVVVRLLAESEFGTYAVGLVVLTVLLSMNELGVSVAVIQRRGSVDDIAPTVVTLSILSSAVLTLAGFVLAPYIAEGMGAPQATWLIRLLVVGVLIDGLVAVPNALIMRALWQRKRLVIDSIAFAVGTPVTIGLALAGYGAWSLGWGAVLGNLVSGVLAYAWAPARYRPGWRREVVPELLRFGLPLAGASLLLLVMLNADYVIVGRELGPRQLGLYLLAFNVCAWPVTVIASAVRRVTLATFSRMQEESVEGGRDGFTKVAGLVLAITLPVCAGLSLYAPAVIEVLYGERWAEAADALRFLALLSVGRVAVEITYDYLAAIGRTASNIWLHLVWLVALVPALLVGTRLGGIEGAGAAHAIVVVVIVLPLLAVLLGRAGVGLGDLLRHALLPALGVLALAVTAAGVHALGWGALASLLVGGVLGGLVYFASVWPMRRTALELWNLAR